MCNEYRAVTDEKQVTGSGDSNTPNEVTTPTSSSLMGKSSGIPSLAAQSPITTPSAQDSLLGSLSKALPPTPPSMPPLPGPSLDIGAAPLKRGPLIIAKELSATMSVNNVGVFDPTDIF